MVRAVLWNCLSVGNACVEFQLPSTITEAYSHWLLRSRCVERLRGVALLYALHASKVYASPVRGSTSIQVVWVSGSHESPSTEALSAGSQPQKWGTVRYTGGRVRRWRLHLHPQLAGL